MKAPLDWLLRQQPYVRYVTRRDNLHEATDASEMTCLKSTVENDPLIKAMLESLPQWEKNIVSGHKNAGLLLHQLCFLADIGFDINHPVILKTAKTILSHTDANGIPKVPVNIPKHFGGSGEDTWGWALCDAPVVLYALARVGCGPEALEKPAAHLTGLLRGNGWPCTGSDEIGKFRGPGRKDDPCPYATLQMTKFLLQLPSYRESEAVRTGAETILGLWDRSKEEHPYMFYMGTDFRKLKAPPIWYDIISVTDVLSQCGWLKNDGRLREMTGLIASKMDENGCCTPESVYLSKKDWDFGQKKAPSGYLTYLAHNILQRMDIQQ